MVNSYHCILSRAVMHSWEIVLVIHLKKFAIQVHVFLSEPFPSKLVATFSF